MESSSVSGVQMPLSAPLEAWSTAWTGAGVGYARRMVRTGAAVKHPVHGGYRRVQPVPGPSPGTLCPGRPPLDGTTGSDGTTHGARSPEWAALGGSACRTWPESWMGTGRRSGRSPMKRNVFAAASMSVLLVAMLVPGSATAASPQRFEQGNIRRAQPGLQEILANRKGNRPVEVAVQLRGQPVSTYEGVAIAAGTIPVRGPQAGHPPNARQPPAAHRGPSARPGRHHPVHLHGRLQRLPHPGQGPAAGQDLAPRQRAGVLPVPRHTRDNVNTVPYIGADKTWGQTGRTGKGVKIAIIDTGINYYHVDFAGKGNAAWKADDTTIREPGTFPTGQGRGWLRPRR